MKVQFWSHLKSVKVIKIKLKSVEVLGFSLQVICRLDEISLLPLKTVIKLIVSTA